MELYCNTKWGCNIDEVNKQLDIIEEKYKYMIFN